MAQDCLEEGGCTTSGFHVALASSLIALLWRGGERRSAMHQSRLVAQADSPSTLSVLPLNVRCVMLPVTLLAKVASGR